MNRLPLRLRPRPEEPGHGILMRLGARNGYESTRRFAASIGIDFRKALAGSNASHLASMAGLEPEFVDHFSPKMILPGRRVALSGHEFELGDWSTRDRRYCPACHALDFEEAHRLRLQPAWYLSHRSIWDVRPISACPVHRIQLSNHCHRCGENLGWQTTSVLQCAHCRADLLSAPCVSMDDPVGDYVTRRLKGQPCGNDVLDRLSLSSAMHLCERLGQIEAVGAVHTLPRQSPDMILRARTVGFRMTSEFQRSVFSALDAVIRNGEGSHGLHSAYGWIYGEWLAHSEQSNDQVRAILFDHAVCNGVISREEPRLGNRPRKTITMTQAARRMGMSYKRARATAAEAGIVPQGSRRSVAFTMDAGAVANLKAVARAKTPMREAARLLETGKAQVADLLEAGLLHRSAGGAVNSASITQLLNGLINHCCAGSDPEELISMAVAARNAAVPLWRIIRAARDGVIPYWQISGSGLSQFGVQLRDVIMLRAAPRTLSVEAAARRIGVHHDCARAMARCGTIAVDGGLLTNKGIARFEREYVVGAALARDIGRSPRALHRQLLEAGVHPAFDLKTHRQAIYRRLDVSRLGLFRIIPVRVEDEDN
ncbi:TniQ family protein [Sphingobium sp. RSMS]|uniref:TniQ family protein n=1 Tax=Sphingobium sp. RSMS TaxID=520734 RepID=UPI0010FA3D95|nr:TniQ family protein [Sphingobium sp. RSMS]UXC90285.1 TniQ family protein [Sphingobium sp. RSMS]